MHKTVVSSEYMLTNILSRANFLFSQGHDLFATPQLKLFLQSKFTVDDFKSQPDLLDKFAQIDDNDVISAIKVWQDYPDKILSLLCQNIISRNLFKTEITKEKVDQSKIETIKSGLINELGIEEKDLHYFLETEILVNNAYNENFRQILILTRSGEITDLSMASDNLNISALSAPVEKYCLCYHNIN
jgi:HD superfamily phosphohydrolase